MLNVKSHPIRSGLIVVVVIAVGALVIRSISHGGSSSDGADTPMRPDIAPAEYLYLDKERVGSYLSQLENGLSQQEKTSLTKISNVSGEAGLGGVKLGGSLQQQHSLEETVTPTDNSRFYRLMSLLNDKDTTVNGRPPLAHLNASQSASAVQRQLSKAWPGGFVEIDDAQVTRPPYVLVYYSLRQAISDRSVFTLGLSLADLPGARRFARRVGDNARFPLLIHAGLAPAGYARPAEDRLSETSVRLPEAQKEKAITVLLTSQFNDLAPESDLFRTLLTVVGKVIEIPTVRKPGENSNFENKYVDEESVSTYAPALRHATAHLQALLGVKQGRIEGKLSHQLSIVAPGLVVLPVAIFK